MLPQPQSGKTRRKLLIITGSAVLVFILAGAAYLAGIYMNRNGSNQNGLAGGQVLTQSGGPVTRREVGPQVVTPAPELPTLQTDVRGVFLSRSGNTFTVGTGNVGITIQGSGSGQMNPQVSYNGPSYQVVLTKNTLIYKDTTPYPGNTGPIQQTVVPGTLDDLNTTTMVSVWGKKTGDRYIADVILYMQPEMKLKGGSGGTLKLNINSGN